MADPAPTRTAIEPGLVQRVTGGLQVMLTGKAPAWFGPFDPVAPVANNPEDQTRGRQFDFQVGVNTQFRPRQNEGLSTYDQLRWLADNYDLMRLCIETRKDQIVASDWSIGYKDTKTRPDDFTRSLEKLFNRPDGENDWDEWVRMLLEDMLVIDAATIYTQLNRGGSPYAFHILDGATIKRVITPLGRTPTAPMPAYQQILKGLPAVNYTCDELLYRPRNRRSNKLYGFSPVEQVLTSVNIALRRQSHQLEYFTEGNVPSALISVPPEWTPTQISDFQKWWDSITTPGSKQRARFVPGGTDYIDTKAAAMGASDEVMNEWLARIVCFAFSIAPTQLVKMNNRATSDTQANTATDEGYLPTRRWIKRTIDQLIEKHFKRDDVHLTWVDRDEPEPETKARIHQIYSAIKVLTDDEIRDDIGKDPLTPEQREQLSPPPPPELDPHNPDNKQDEGDKPKPPTAEDVAKLIKVEPVIHLGDTLVEVYADRGRTDEGA